MDYLSYQEAKEFLKNNYKINNYNDWLDLKKNENFPKNYLPLDPEKFYRDKGWKDWKDFLNAELKTLPFSKFKKLIKTNKIKNAIEYEKFINEKYNIINFQRKGWSLPTRPRYQYKNKWSSWEKLTGYHVQLKLEKQNNKLELQTEFIKNKKNLISEQNFGKKLRIEKDFHILKKYARSLKLRGQREWLNHYSNLIKDYDENAFEDYFLFKEKNSLIKLPLLDRKGYANPARAFKDFGWKSWQDFLGTKNLNRNQKSWTNFSETRTYARTLSLQNRGQWERHYKQHKGIFKFGNKKLKIPLRPDRINFYKNEWVSWKDFLNIKKINRKGDS